MNALARGWVLRWWGFFAALCLTSMLVVLAGCGQSDTLLQQAPVVPAVSETASVSTESTESPESTRIEEAGTSSTQEATISSVSEPSGDVGEFLPVFEEVARELAPIPVFGLRELPEEVSLAEEWWPLINMATPDEYSGPAQPNPFVSLIDSEGYSAEILFKCGQGWLMVWENARGDLGLTTGRPIGEKGDGLASFYEINDGLLVHWSAEGLWYAVFGRQVDAEVVVDFAMQLEEVPVR